MHDESCDQEDKRHDDRDDHGEKEQEGFRSVVMIDTGSTLIQNTFA